MKFQNLRINNFRGFSQLRVEGLGRLNLLVGSNNSGKTTVLEALQVLAGGEVGSIWSVMSRRGEEFTDERDAVVQASANRQIDVRRLFKGHEIRAGLSFSLDADSDLGPISLVANITTPDLEMIQKGLFDHLPVRFPFLSDSRPAAMMTLTWGPAKPSVIVPITPQNGVSLDSFRQWARLREGNGFSVRFVTAESLNADVVTDMLEDVMLTEEEILVTKALQLIEPEIERIAPASSKRSRSNSYGLARRGIMVKLDNVDGRVPIGSLGDGIWRMLGLALSVVQAKNGLLLIDEVDTGLHHSVMKDLWRFLQDCARKFDVQIVATTHSRDCFQSLATICREDVGEGSDVTIHRIERGQTETVAYSEQEIIAAAEYDMEVR